MVKRIITTIIRYSLLIAICWTTQCAIAQENSDKKLEKIQFVYDADNINFFDNREVHSPYQCSQTLFGSRLGAEVGILFEANTIIVGAMGVKDFGQSGIANKDFTFLPL